MATVNEITDYEVFTSLSHHLLGETDLRGISVRSAGVFDVDAGIVVELEDSSGSLRWWAMKYGQRGVWVKRDETGKFWPETPATEMAAGTAYRWPLDPMWVHDRGPTHPASTHRADLLEGLTAEMSDRSIVKHLSRGGYTVRTLNGLEYLNAQVVAGDVTLPGRSPAVSQKLVLKAATRIKR